MNMLYEGIKETQNTRIEKDDDTKDEIEMLYSFDVVLFENTVLKSEETTISISFFSPLKIYDIVIEDNENLRLISYESKTELDEDLMKLFNLTKNEEIIDKNNVKYKCMSHSVEYTL